MRAAGESQDRDYRKRGGKRNCFRRLSVVSDSNFVDTTADPKALGQPLQRSCRPVHYVVTLLERYVFRLWKQRLNKPTVRFIVPFIARQTPFIFSAVRLLR